MPEGPSVRIDALIRGSWFELEIGPGPKAGFLVERVEAEPDVAVLGLEIRRKWAFVGDERLATLGQAHRARVLCEDARDALRRLQPDGGLRRAFLHFPDPWWKKRHAKRLVLSDDLLDQLARLLSPGGELYIQTDVEERANLYERTVARHDAFEPAFESPRISENPFRARSPREHRAISDGLPVFRLLWRRKGGL